MKSFQKLIIINLFHDYSNKMRKKDLAAYASSCAFFLIVSIIPLLILLSSCLPYTAVHEEDLIYAVTDLTPGFANSILIRLIQETYSYSISITSISAIVTIWAGALGMLSIIRGLNSIYEVVETRNYFYLRIISAFYTLILVLVIVIMLTLMVFGNLVKAFIATTFPEFVTRTIPYYIYVKFSIITVVATLLFALIYTFVPSVKLKFKDQLPGAVFTSIVWYVFSWFFSVYVKFSNSYSLYGSLATPVIMMFWLYFCIYIFLIGAFINLSLTEKKIEGDKNNE